MKYTKVSSIDQLFELVEKNNHEFFISMGVARSSKYITLGEEDGTLEILNEIDGTTQVLTAEEVMDETNTNVGIAIKCGAFWMVTD